MTVSTTDITSGPYLGNDVNDQFSYTFRVVTEDQLTVFEFDDTGVVTTLVVDTDYSVAGIGNDNGGTVTRLAGPLPTGYTWLIRSNYLATQQRSFPSQGPFFPFFHEAAIDKLTFLVQQLYDLNSRTIRLPEYDLDPISAGVVLANAETRAGKVLGFDADGKVIYPGLVVSEFDGKIYTLATALADDSLVAGQYTLTTGYSVDGDGGWNIYLNHPAGTAPAYDNGKWIHNAASNVDMEGLFNYGVNIKQFGAVMDGVTDDTAAVQACYDFAPGGRVDVPAGRCILTAPITYSNKKILTVGEGSGASIFQCNGSGAFIIDLSGLSDKDPILFNGVGFEANENGLRDALVITGQGTSALGPQLTVSECAFAGIGNATTWRVPLNLTDCSYSKIENNFARGNTSDRTKMLSFVQLTDSTDVKILNNFGYWADVAVNMTGFCEGITVENSHFVPVSVGVRHKGTGNLVWVNDCHISAYVAGVQLGTTGVNDVNHCHVNNNLIFKNSLSTLNFTAIDIQSKKAEVEGNEVLIPGGSSAGGTENGIVLGPDSEYCRVYGNQVADMDTAILLQASSTLNSVYGNTFLGNATDISDLGDENLVRINQTSNKIPGALVSLSAPQSITDSTLTPISWDVVDRNYQAVYDAVSPTRLTVPSKTNQVRLKSSIVWDNNGTGERLIEIRKNGASASVGLAADRRAGVAGTPAGLSTAILDVNPGDYFEVHVRHTVGVGFDVLNNALTWFEMEIIQ